MVPKPLYELMPYLYLLVGSGIIVTLRGYATPVGLLLFAIGAWMWLMRSDYRRINPRQPLSAKRGFFWGEVVYELLPFGYVLLGLLIFGFLNHPVRLFSGPLMVAVGLSVLVLRASQRKKNNQVVRLRERAADSPAPVLTPDRSPDQSYAQLIFAEPAFNDPSPEYHPSAAKCSSCQIVDICDSVKLSQKAIQEIMRLSQTLSPDDAFELYRDRVEAIEKRRVSDAELRSVVNLLYRYSDLCATWRKTGRLGAL